VMRVSQRLDYAIRAVVLLAAQPPGKYVAAGELADRLLLPRRFVEQQLSVLVKAGIVESRRGPAGGVAMARAPREVRVLDLVQALEGAVIDVPRQTESAVAEMWRHMAEMVEGHLASTTVEDLLTRERELEVRRVPMYYI